VVTKAKSGLGLSFWRSALRCGLRNLNTEFITVVLGLTPANGAACGVMIQLNLDQSSAGQRQQTAQSHPTGGDVQYAYVPYSKCICSKHLDGCRLVRFEARFPPSLHTLFLSAG
jgi:hypothetical protein